MDQVEVQNNLQLDQICFYVAKSQQPQNLLIRLQNCCQQLANLELVSMYIGANIFIGEKGISKIFETLKNLQNLKYLKLKLDQGNHIGLNSGQKLIEGLNSLQNLKSLKLKLNLFNNIKKQESDVVGKSFCKLIQLESLSLTFYKYLGERNIHIEVINSIKNLVKLKNLQLKIKESNLKAFDCYEILNFDQVILPELQEFSFSVKNNNFKQPTVEILSKLLEVFNLSEEFIQEKADEKILGLLGIFKQIHFFKNVQRVSIEIDNYVSLNFMQMALSLIQDLQHLIFLKLSFAINSLEQKDDLTKFAHQLIALQEIQELNLKIKKDLSIVYFFKLLKDLTKLKNLQKFSFEATHLYDIVLSSESEDDIYNKEEDLKQEILPEIREEQMHDKDLQIDDQINEEEIKKQIEKETNKILEVETVQIKQENQTEENIQIQKEVDEIKIKEEINSSDQQFLVKQHENETKQRIEEKINLQVENVFSMKETNQENQNEVRILAEKEEILDKYQRQNQEDLEQEIIDNVAKEKYLFQENLTITKFQDVINFYSGLNETNFIIQRYFMDSIYKQLKLNEFFSQIKSLKNLKYQCFYDEDYYLEGVNFDQLQFFNLKQLKIHFCFLNQYYNLTQFFNDIKVLQELEKLSIQIQSQQKMNLEQITILKETLLNLKKLKKLNLFIGFEQSENNQSLKHFIEILQQLNLDELKLSISEQSFDANSAQLFVDEKVNLKVNKMLKLSISQNNQFFFNGVDKFFKNLMDSSQIVEFRLEVFKNNLKKDQARDIFSQLPHLKQVEKISLILPDLEVTEEDVKFIFNSLKTLKNLQEIKIKINSFLILYLMNLHQYLPFLGEISSKYFKTSFKRSGLNRSRFSKSEAEKQQIVVVKNQEQTQLHKNFELMRVNIHFKRLLQKQQIDSRWVIKNLIMPKKIQLKLNQLCKNSLQSTVEILKYFKFHQNIRYIKFIFPGNKFASPQNKRKIKNIFYKIKYLVVFKCQLSLIQINI
ncbi:hypothetical protein ABPG74_008003 [Tetrahymena malaccensis]